MLVDHRLFGFVLVGDFFTDWDPMGWRKPPFWSHHHFFRVRRFGWLFTFCIRILCKSKDSGQIIAASHDLTPNGGLVREIPLFQGNLGWWNIIIWPEGYEKHLKSMHFHPTREFETSSNSSSSSTRKKSPKVWSVQRSPGNGCLKYHPKTRP